MEAEGKKEITKLQYLQSKLYQSQLVFMQVLYHGRTGIWRCWFLSVEEGEPENQEKTLGACENQQQTQPTYGTGPESIDAGMAHWEEAWPSGQTAGFEIRRSWI